MDKKEGTSINFMPDDLLEIICILERAEKHNSYQIIGKRIFFSHYQLSRQEWRIDAIEELRFRSANSNSSENRELSFDDKLPNKRRRRRKNKSSNASRSASQHTDMKLKDSSNVRLAQQRPKKKSSAPVASQHTDNKHKDSSDVQLAQLKPNKKSPAQVARDRAR